MHYIPVFKRSVSILLCLVVAVVMTVTMTACGDGDNTDTGTTTTTAAATTTTASAATTTTTVPGPTELGIGYDAFFFNVVDQDGNKTEFKIHTDELTVAEALVILGLIEGEDSEDGLIVQTVNGIAADVDGIGWVLYINGEKATTNVSATEVTDGATYEFKLEPVTEPTV